MTYLPRLLQIVRWAGIVALVMVFTQFGPQTASLTAVYGSAFAAAVVVGFARSRPITLAVASALLGWAAFTVIRRNDPGIGATMAVGAIGGILSVLLFRNLLAEAPPEPDPDPERRHWLPEWLQREEAAAARGRVGIDWLVFGTWLATLGAVFSSAQLSAYAASTSESGASRATDFGTFLGQDARMVMAVATVVTIAGLVCTRRRLRAWARALVAAVAIAVALLVTVASQVAPETGGPFPPALPWASVGAGLLLIGLETLELDGYLSAPEDEEG